MAENRLVAENRSAYGKGAARKLRAAGRIPGVIYGKGDHTAVAVDSRSLQKLLETSEAGLNTLIDLDIRDGATRTVLVKDLQRDPVRGFPLHADFYAVDLKKAVQVTVPIHFVGKAAGEELGGVVDHTLHEVECECLPRTIPDSIEVDVTNLGVGDSLHLSDLAPPEGVAFLSDPETTVATVVMPTAEPEEEEAAPEEGEGEAIPEGEAPAAEAEASGEEGASGEDR